MLFTKRCSYAVLAMAFMAGDAQRVYRVRDIADVMGLPFHFLGQIMRELSKSGLLRSSKGKCGGFVLSRPSGDYTLLEIRGVIDGNESLRRCLFCASECGSGECCPFIHLSAPIYQWVERRLGAIKLRDVTALISHIDQNEQSLMPAIPAGQSEPG